MDAEEGLRLFDRSAPVGAAALIGRWRGSGLPTGHPFDGLLEAYGWYGKEVVDAETVHPLLFRDRAGRPRAVDPAHAPLGLLRAAPGLARTTGARRGFALVRPLRYTRRPAARLRPMAHRGAVSTALLYDRLPVVDHLRALPDGRLLGLMDMRGVARPFFFLLEREGSEREGSEREGSEREGSEREGSEREGSEREGSEREGSEREGSEREVSEREVSERAAHASANVTST